MKKALFAGVIALALAVAPSARADEPAPTPSAAEPVPTATPLQTRPAKPLALAPTNEGTPFGYKLLVGGVVAVAAGLWLKKKRGTTLSKGKKKRSAIDVLGRTSIGVRNELLVVDVEGTRLLIGMTPGSMQTLAVLQTPENVVGEESPELPGEAKYAEPEVAAVQAPSARVKTLREQLEETEEPQEQEDDEIEELSGRVRSLLDARKRRVAAQPPESRLAPIRRMPQQAPSRARIPGQAKGLLLSMEDARNDQDITKLGDW